MVKRDDAHLRPSQRQSQTSLRYFFSLLARKLMVRCHAANQSRGYRKFAINNLQSEINNLKSTI
jgi:hypothetical protein